MVKRFKFHISALVLMIMFIGTLSVFASTNDDKQNEIDSLLKILPVSHDEERVDILVQLSKLYLSISMVSSREYAKMALKNATDINDKTRIAEAYKLLGNISYYKGEYNDVIGFYDSSLMQYRQMHDSFGQSKVLNNLGIIYQHIGDYRKSIDYQLESLELKIKLNDSAGIANSYNNIGSIYYDLRELEKSSAYFTKALEISKKLGNTASVQGILNNLGLIYQDMGNIAKSKDYFLESIEAGKITDNLRVVATGYHNYAKSLFLSGEYSKALEYYKKALSIYEQLGVKNAQTLNNIGQVYLDLDYYQKAITYLKQALAYAKQNNQFSVLSEIYQNLAVANERMGNYKEAYYNYLQFNTYQDSMMNQVYSSRIEDLVSKNEMQKSRDQLEKARLKIEKTELEVRRRNLAIYSVLAGLIGMLIFALVILRLLRLKSKSNVLLRQQNDEILRSQETIKKINKALTDSEATLRSIFDVSPFAILVIDSKGIITDCNDTSLKMFRAKNRRNLLEKRIGKFIQSGVNEESTDIIARVKTNQLSKVQYIIKRIDLSSFQAELTGRMIHDNTGEDGSYIIVVTDITERLKFIENLKMAKSKAEESDTLKTAFLTNMSHEIRTPMNSIIGFSNLLMDMNLSPAKRSEYLSHILQSSSLLLSLIDDIIDISKIEAGQLNFNPEEFSLNPVVKERFKSFKDVNKSGELKFNLNLPEGGEDIICRTDIQRLRQVLGNLLSNAVKFTPSGLIELGYEIKTVKDHLMAEFYVRDTGIGIHPDMHEIIFERFRQEDDSRTRSFGGTGLGLAICKKLVDMMGGEIWVDSEKGKGATFYFTIPVFQKKQSVNDITRNSSGKKFNWKDKILLVAEDENSNYELIKATLNATGIKLIRAFNGEEAIDRVETNPNIDLVLMDIRMPKINGYDATRRIKAIRSELPVLAITAYAMTEDESKSREAGCDHYISKPIKPGFLLEVINQYL